MPIEPQVDKILYSRNNLIKRLLEDESGIEESSRTLLQLLGKQPTFLTLCSNLVAGKTYYRILHFVYRTDCAY